jgi:hypothetical protein
MATKKGKGSKKKPSKSKKATKNKKYAKGNKGSKGSKSRSSKGSKGSKGGAKQRVEPSSTSAPAPSSGEPVVSAAVGGREGPVDIPPVSQDPPE